MGNQKKYSVVVNALVVKDKKILLAKRSMEEKHVPGLWSPPGGKLEATGVSWGALQKTAKREVKEEVGVEINDKMLLLENNTFEHDEDGLLVIAITFLCFYRNGTPKPLEDTTAVKWISEKEIDNYEFTHSNVRRYVVKGFKMLEKKLELL